MKHECMKLKDAIYNKGMTGQDLPAELLEHSKECPNCARVVEESNRLDAVLKTAAVTPQAPDCRAAVLDKIDLRSRRRRVAFALSCAAALLLIIGGFVVRVGNHTDAGRKTIIAIKSPPVPRPDIDIPVDANRYQPTKNRSINDTKVTHIDARKHLYTHRMIAKHQIRRHFDPKPVTEQVARKNTAQPIKTAQVVRPKLVFTTWKAEDADKSYSYTVENSETNERVSCSVERTGNSITISIESTQIASLPVKNGGIDNE